MSGLLVHCGWGCMIINTTTVADAQLALAEAKNSIGSIKPEYENVGLAILYFNLY